MKSISLLLQRVAARLERYARYHRLREITSHLGAIGNNAIFRLPDVCSCPEKIFLGEYTSIYEGARFILSPVGDKGRFIMKSHSYAAQGLTVITGNHQRQVGLFNLEAAETHRFDTDKDVIVEEDVGIGVGVTLLSGVRIGRGATIGAGSVCVSSVPPYAVALGNPAQVVGFVFTPEQIVEHEKVLYPESDRLPLDKLEKNYKRYYLDQLPKIANYMNLTIHC